MNKAKQVRKEDTLDLNKLSDYLVEHLTGFNKQDTLTIKQFKGGASNLTYQLEWNNQKVILRTSPKGANIKSAHDMVREYRIITKVKEHFSYAPKTIHLCEDKEIIGRKFYLMQKVEGIIPRKEFPIPISSSQATKICQELINVHVKLHEIDIKKTGLIELGYPQGYIQRQILGWNKRYKNARLKDSLQADGLMNWLEEHMPDDAGSSVIHNDYKLDNIVFCEKNPTKITAVLDWEMTTIGSPLMDLGCSLAYWVEKNDSPEMQAIRMMPTSIDGMMTRKEIIAYYCEKRNISIDNFDYYYIFGLFRLAVIVQQIYYRYAQGKTSNPAFKQFDSIAKILINQANAKVKFEQGF